MFKLLVFAMLRNNKISTRIMEHLYNSEFFDALSGKDGHQTRHSSIAARLSTMNPAYFKGIYESVIEQYGPELQGQGLYKSIRRFDSTTIAISSSLVEYGMRVGRPPADGYPKVQLKFSVQLHAGLPASVKTFFDQSHLSEETALKEAILDSEISAGDILVFDRGLKSRAAFVEFDKADLQFVTRGAKSTKYDVLAEHRRIKGRKADGLRFLQDSRVHLYGDGGKVIEHPFRLIEVEDLAKGKTLLFITNDWDRSAMDIARIYKQRWDIEVFFRFLKQQLGITHLINRSRTGVEIQMYVALITAVLLLVLKQSNGLSSYTIAKMKFEDDLLMLLVKELGVKPPS